MMRKKLDMAGRNKLGKTWTLPEGINCGKTGHCRKEYTAEKLDIVGRNKLRKNWTLPDGRNC
jgi:hypothetical protein